MTTLATGPKVRVAMVGAGGMANRVHYPSLASFPDVEIAGICDLARPAAPTADKYGIEKRYTDYQKMIEEVAPDAVYVIGQPDIMYRIWVWCLQQGSTSTSRSRWASPHQARSLAYLAEKNGCITQVSFQRRTCPMVVQLREECLKRGPIVHAVCRFYKCLIEPYLDARDHMMDDGVHAIDTLRWMCGGEVVEVQSVDEAGAVPDINFISATLHFDNGATGFLINSWTQRPAHLRVEMHAPGICAEAEHEGKGRLYADGDTRASSTTRGRWPAATSSTSSAASRPRTASSSTACRAGRQPGSHFADAVKTMEVAERILAQALLRE